MTPQAEDLILRIREAVELDRQGRPWTRHSVAEAIIRKLERDDFRWAAHLYRDEGDKLWSDDHLRRVLKDFFGCRLHLRLQCPDSWCRETLELVG